MIKGIRISTNWIGACALGLAACGGGAVELGVAADEAALFDPGIADPEEFELCKYGSVATFDYSWTDLTTGVTTTGQTTLNDGECQVLVLIGGLGATVTVTELVPAGYQLDKVEVTERTTNLADYEVFTTTVEPGPTITGYASGSGSYDGYLHGVLAEFFNSQQSAGGQGCTPGFWKNHTGLKKQADAWPPSGYAHTDLFDTVFGVTSSYGGTLLEAAGRGGGGEAALMRHATAALLNAATSAVASNFTIGGVIQIVRDAYASGDFEAAKDQLAAANEQVCPL